MISVPEAWQSPRMPPAPARAAIRALKAQGQSILVVDKSLRELAEVADDCVVLERGRDVWHGTPAALTGDVAQRFLGV